ncbi:ead/Ea22-like family protein [Escherichia coli]|uniref:ead/Ea22-like family protein n=1 Tax=Escherichia coli TaxID=562 RepID=UPI001C9AD617|nr:ead/Ea22-like family protein [Escherichia coli]MBY7424889.1 ead/Ea22-like family protein [Escherichia coli]
MSNIDKRALREIAEAAVGAHERLSVMPPDDIFDISLAEGTQLDADITALNALNSAANPTTVLALLDELEAAESGFPPLTVERLMREKDALEKRIAELEAREVVLPQRYSMLHRVDFDEPYHTEMVYKQHQVLEALHDAGICIKVE